MHYYALIYRDKVEDSWYVYITMAESIFKAEEKGKEDVEKWKASSKQNKNIEFHKCEHIDKQKLEKGEIVFCFAT